MTKPKEPKSPRNGTQFKKGRRPHNASGGHKFSGLDELVNKMGAEQRSVTIDAALVQMSREERLNRVTIERALAGKTRDLVHVLRLMVEHPDIIGPGREQIIVFTYGNMAHV